MHFNSIFRGLSLATIMFSGIDVFGQSVSTSSAPAAQSTSPVSISIYDRTRSENWQWFAAPPQSETYSYLHSLLRIGISQTAHKIDWQLQLSQPALLFAPADAISDSCSGQLGLGASYYAASENNRNAAAAFSSRVMLSIWRGSQFARRPLNSSTARNSRRIRILRGCRQTALHRPVGSFDSARRGRTSDGVDGHFRKGRDPAGMAHAPTRVYSI